MTECSSDDNRRLSVMTLNLRFGLADDGDDSWPHRKSRVSSLFADRRPHWIAFQEANWFQIDFLREVLEEYHVIGKRHPAPDFWQNNVIFYRPPWQCIYSDHFFLSHTPDLPSRFAESRWPRQCTIGIFENDGCRVAGVNTHLDFDEKVQEKSARLILDRLEKAAGNLPAVLMGDFNADPGSPAHRVFTGQNEGPTRSARGFAPVFNPPYPGTHHAFSGTPDGSHIDWILYRGGLELENAEVCRSRAAGGYPSDHFPVCATLRLPPV